MKYWLIISIYTLASVISFGQLLPLEWVKANEADEVFAISVVESCAIGEGGFVYSVGNFSGEVDFHFGDSELVLNAQGSNDMFIQKHSSDGSIIWLKQFGANNASIIPSQVVLDKEGNVIVTGSFSKTIDFDPGPDVHDMQGGAMYKDGFLLKLNSNGEFIWSYLFDGQQTLRCNDISITPENDIIVVGEFFQSASFNQSEANMLYNSNGYSDCFVTKISESGAFVWAKHFGGQDVDRAFSVDVNQQGEIVVGGDFFFTVDFNPGAGVSNLTAGNSIYNRDGYLLKLSSNGVYVWAKQIGGANLSGGSVSNVSFDYLGNIVYCGNYGGEVDFDPNSGVFNLQSVPNSLNNGFLVKLNALGEFIFAKSLNVTSMIDLTELEVDGQNNIYLSGSFKESIDVNPNVDDDLWLSNEGSNSMFLLKYNYNGLLLGYNYFEGDANANILADFSFDYSAEIMYACGMFQNEVDFDCSQNNLLLTREGNGLGFILKMSSLIESISDTSDVVQYVEMPNVLTINADGKNEFFTPVGKTDLIDVKNITVLNRWGDIVYNSNSFTNPWDGSTKGQPCSSGVYYWILEFEIDGVAHFKQGIVTLIN